MALASVSTDIAPLYERPDPQSPRLDEVLYGMSVQVIKESDSGWCYLRSEHHTEGYAPTACLQRDAAVAAAWRKYKKMLVLAPYIDVQPRPEAEASRVASVPRGGVLVALGAASADGWQKVGLVDGSVGYTRASYLGEAITNWESLLPADMRWNLVETALSYNGAALRSGGRTPLGIDSVGLVAMAYMMNGVLVPRQLLFNPQGVLHAIPEKKMDEGDLIYFSDSVGIYMGEGKFVHATSLPGSEGVVVSSLRPKDADYRADLAGRIVTVASLY